MELLYGEGAKPRRDTLYAEAMERLSRAHPADDEAKAFYALALMGMGQGVRHVPTYMRAGAIAEEVYRRNPRHPGALHYVIHAFDDPTHAPLGLYAAREYSGIAADAAHAQHMTTHIFLALGMWDEVVSQNTIAANQTHWGPGHYTAWLGYALAQQGKADAARAHLERARQNMSNRNPAGQRSYLGSMRADYLINTERWSDPVIGWPLDTTGIGKVAGAKDRFALAYAALKRGELPRAEAALASLDTVGVPGILRLALQGAVLVARADTAAGLALLRRAAAAEDALPVEFGPPDIVKPTHELLGEVLLNLGHAAEAKREFERALEMAPGRALSLRGLAGRTGERD